MKLTLDGRETEIPGELVDSRLASEPLFQEGDCEPYAVRWTLTVFVLEQLKTTPPPPPTSLFGLPVVPDDTDAPHLVGHAENFRDQDGLVVVDLHLADEVRPDVVDRAPGGNWDPPAGEPSPFVSADLFEAAEKVEKASEGIFVPGVELPPDGLGFVRDPKPRGHARRELTLAERDGETFASIRDPDAKYVSGVVLAGAPAPRPVREFRGRDLQTLVNLCCVWLESCGFDPGTDEANLCLVLSPPQARDLAASQEFRGYTNGAADALREGYGYVRDMIDHPDNPNARYGLTTHVYGLRVFVRDTPP
jgi:hypothetical protein